MQTITPTFISHKAPDVSKVQYPMQLATNCRYWKHTQCIMGWSRYNDLTKIFKKIEYSQVSFTIHFFQIHYVLISQLWWALLRVDLDFIQWIKHTVSHHLNLYYVKDKFHPAHFGISIMWPNFSGLVRVIFASETDDNTLQSCLTTLELKTGLNGSGNYCSP